jgi:tetratricopeptide (TPR) repeat protein
MKSKYVILASALLISVSTFAQKDQIKAAEKALKSGNPAEAVSVLKTAEPLMANATEPEKAQYYFVNGNAHLDLAKKNVAASDNLKEASVAYQKLIAIEKATGKSKYTDQAQESIKEIKTLLFNGAIEDDTKKNYAGAAAKLKLIYDLDNSETEKLYFAAGYYVNAEDYTNALNCYNELKRINYSGEATAYYAKSIVTEKEDYFTTKSERDQMIKLKTHKSPRDEKIPSKRGEIYKNIALILVQEGKTNEAKTAFAEARVANPDDVSLMLAEADLYLKLEDFVAYKKIVGQILEKNPNDADLLYNLGVITSSTDPLEAEKYYKRAIEIKPDYVNAYLNLATLKLAGEKKIIDEMNKLGTSEKDNKRYEVLKNERNQIFLNSLPYLEKANELDPKNEDVANTLLNVYGALEMTDKKKALKAKMGK